MTTEPAALPSVSGCRIMEEKGLNAGAIRAPDAGRKQPAPYRWPPMAPCSGRQNLAAAFAASRGSGEKR